VQAEQIHVMNNEFDLDPIRDAPYIAQDLLDAAAQCSQSQPVIAARFRISAQLITSLLELTQKNAERNV
jgi:hypothetical protein